MTDENGTIEMDENEAIEKIEDLDFLLTIIGKFQQNSLSRYINTVKEATNAFIGTLVKKRVITPEMSSQALYAIENHGVTLELREFNVPNFDSLGQYKVH